MKKNTRILRSLLSVSLLALGLAGCSSLNSEAEDGPAGAAEAYREADAVETDWNMELELLNENDSRDLTLNWTGSLSDPGSGEENLTCSDETLGYSTWLESFSHSLRRYTQTGDGTVTTYVNLDDIWYSAPGSYDLPAADLLDALAQEEESLHRSEQDPEEEPSDSEFTGERTAEILSDTLDLFAQYTDSEALIDTGTLTGRELTVSLVTEAETVRPLSLSFTLEDGEAPVPAGEDYVLGSVSLSLSFSYPEELSLTLPDEAADAQELFNEEGPDLLGFEEDGEEDVSPDDGSVYEEYEGIELLREYGTGDPDAILLNTEELTVTVRRVYRDSDDSLYADLTFTNLSSRDLEIDTTGIAVNHTMADASTYETIPSGEEVTVCLSVDDLSSLYIESVGSLSFRFAASDTETDEEVLVSPVLTIPVDEGPDKYVLPEGLVTVCENETLQILAGENPEDSGDGTDFPLWIISRTSSVLEISCEEAESDGILFDAFLYEELFPESVLHAYVYADAEDLDAAGLGPLPESVILSLTVDDAQTEETLLEETAVALP